MSQLDDALAIVDSLSPLEKLKLMEKLTASLERDLHPPTPHRSLLGLWEGVDVSAKDIDEARREMWGNFPREDI